MLCYNSATKSSGVYADFFFFNTSRNVIINAAIKTRILIAKRKVLMVVKNATSEEISIDDLRYRLNEAFSK